MDISYKTENGGICAELSGELDEYSAEYVRLSLDDLLNKNLNAKKLILDFSGVSFMDSSGVGLVMGRYRLLAPMGKKLQVDNLSARDFQILKMSGIGKLTTLNQRYDNVKEKKYDKD